MAIAETHTFTSANKEKKTGRIKDMVAPSVSLTQAEIRRFLLPFREDWIFAEEATFHDGKLVTQFNTFNQPFRLPPKHLTRNHIIMFTTQASYLLGGCLAKHDPNWPVDENGYCNLIANEQATFTEVRLRFKQFIPNKDGVCLSMWSTGHRLYKGKLFVNICFGFESACYGNFKAVLAVDHSFLPSISSEIIQPSDIATQFETNKP